MATRRTTSTRSSPHLLQDVACSAMRPRVGTRPWRSHASREVDSNRIWLTTPLPATAPPKSRFIADPLVGSLFLQLIQRRLRNRRRVRASAALLARTGPMLDDVNQCLTGCNDCRVAAPFVSVEVFPRLSYGRWPPALLRFSHGHDRTGCCSDTPRHRLAFGSPFRPRSARAAPSVLRGPSAPSRIGSSVSLFTMVVTVSRPEGGIRPSTGLSTARMALNRDYSRTEPSS